MNGFLQFLQLSKPGKLPDTGIPVLQNPSSLLDFAMDPFDNRNIAAGKFEIYDIYYQISNRTLKISQYNCKNTSRYYHILLFKVI